VSKTTFALLFALPLLPAILCAGSNSTTMTVSAEVVGRTILTIDNQPTFLEITRDDVARGYVDVPRAVSFHVRSNAANGYAMQFEPVAFPFSRADVKWGDDLARVTGEGSWIFHTYQQGTTIGTFNVRLMLAPEMQPGMYAWPLRFEPAS
jgi:hypothetical protein